MAVTFRGAKGAALTHAELDQNFSELFTSGSVSNTTLTLYKSSSVDTTMTIELPKAGGSIGNIQLKKDDQGNWEGTNDLNYNLSTRDLTITGSTLQKGNIYLEGTIFAHEFQSTLVSSSIIYKSGSTKFGDSADDQHIFTGDIRLSGDIVTQRDIIADGSVIVSGDATVAGNISGSRFYGYTDFNSLLSKPTLVSGSSQVDITNTTKFGTYSGSVHSQREVRLTELSQSTAQINSDERASRIASIADVSSSAHTRREQIRAALELADAQQSLTTNGQIASLTSQIGTVSAQSTAALTGTSASIHSTRLLNTTDTLDGDLTVTGRITAQEFTTEYITSSVIFESGSTKFGDSADDTHIFTGDVTVSNTIAANQFIGTLNGRADTAILANDADQALSSSYATTASFALNVAGAGTAISSSYATTASFAYKAAKADQADQALSSSYATTASFALNTISVETDPIFTAHPAFGISQEDMTDWDTVAGYGNHADEGYATSIRVAQNYALKSGDDITGDYVFVNNATGIKWDRTNNGYADVYGGHLKYYNTVSESKIELAAGDKISLSVEGTEKLSLETDEAKFNVQVTSTSDIVAYQSSDERLKDNVTPIYNALDKVKQIGGYEFDWNDNQTTYEGHDVGVLAQEIEKVLPEIVTTRDNGYKAVRYEKIVALLIEAVKEQQLQIDELKSKL